MSETAKIKVSLALLWSIFATMIGVFATMIGGVIQAGRVLERVDSLPRIQEELRSQSKRLDSVEEVLRRNHIGAIEQKDLISTASYDE